MMARRDFDNRIGSATGRVFIPVRAGSSGWLFAVPVGGWSGGAAGADLSVAKTGMPWSSFDVHTLVLCVCLTLLVVAFSAMFYSVYAYRRTSGSGSAQWHKNAAVEVLWTIVPVFILFGSAWPAMRTVLDSNQKAVPAIAGASPTVVKRYGAAVPVVLKTTQIALVADSGIARR